MGFSTAGLNQSVTETLAAKQPVISVDTADGGGSNGSRLCLGKRELQCLANESSVLISHGEWN